MRKTTDEQDMFEILCDAYEAIVEELYWEYEAQKEQQEEINKV